MTSNARLRAQLNEELGYYPASLDPRFIADALRASAEQAKRLTRYDRKYGPGGSHVNQFGHLKSVVRNAKS